MNLHSESSHRYERGVDPDLADWASRRATSLLARYGGGIVAAGVIDVDNRPAPAAPITLSCQRVNELIGLEISQARVVEILESLGIVRVGENTFLPPTYRVDLECDADLIEEIARINGLDALPDIAPVSRTVAAEPADALFRAQQLTRQTLLGLGLNEAMNYSYLSQSELDAFSTAESDKRLVLPNPVSADYGVMRDSLLPQLSAALGRNHARQVEAPALFEIGRVFFKDRNSKPAEALKVAFGFVAPFGRNVLERRRAVENTEALQTIKGLIEALLARLHSDTVRFVPSEFDAFEKGSSVDIIIGKRELIGRFGLAKESLRHPYRLHAPLALAELDFAAITRRVGRIAKLKPVPAFPPVRRDLAIVAPPTLTCAEIEVAIRRSAPKTLAAIKLFDVYKNSRAFSLEFRATDRTLTDDEVNDAFNNIRDFVKKSLNVEVRES